jgi:hypothetical protein
MTDSGHHEKGRRTRPTRSGWATNNKRKKWTSSFHLSLWVSHVWRFGIDRWNCDQVLGFISESGIDRILFNNRYRYTKLMDEWDHDLVKKSLFLWFCVVFTVFGKLSRRY